MGDEKIVTVAKFDNSLEADIAKQILENEGIKCILQGQNFANVYPVPGLAKVELQVFEKDKSQAIMILKEMDSEEAQ